MGQDYADTQACTQEQAEKQAETKTRPLDARRVWSMRLAGFAPPNPEYYRDQPNCNLQLLQVIDNWHTAKMMMDRADKDLENLAIEDGFEYEDKGSST